MRSRRSRAALVVAGLLALTGCQAIPSSGPVHEGLTNLEQAERQVLFDPHGPAKGASQEDIVQGFVVAASSGVDDYAVARQFLTPDYLRSWDPGAGVTVYEGSRPFVETDEDQGMLRLNVIATVDEHGSLSPATPGPRIDLPFEFEQVDGEWRISSAPTGILLDRSTFTAVWSMKSAYYLTADDKLVPESRWFLNRPTLTTQLVSELLLGPSEGMRSTLRTAFPSGTTMQNNSAPVAGGTVRIDLSPEVLGADAQALEQMRRQLAASLQAVAGVTHYEITVGGAPFEAGAVGLPEPSPGSVEQPGTVILVDNVLGTLLGGKIDPLPGIGERIGALGPTAVSLSADRKSAAVRTADGVSLVLENSVTLFDVRPGQLEPDLDRFGWVWSFSGAAPGEALVSAPGQSPAQLALPLGGGSPTAVRLSPSGSRIAMLVADGEQSAVLVAGVRRDESGRPVGISPDVSVQLWAPGSPVDLDWIDELRLVTLSRSSGTTKVTPGGVGQLQTEQGSISGAVKIGVGGRSNPLRVLDDAGHLFAPQGKTGWQRQQDGVQLLAKTG